MARTFIDSKGYRSFADSGKHVHRWVAEKNFGKIPTGSVVHHVNGNKLVNKPSNLKVMSRGAHSKHHHSTGIKDSFVELGVDLFVECFADKLYNWSREKRRENHKQKLVVKKRERAKGPTLGARIEDKFVSAAAMLYVMGSKVKRKFVKNKSG